MINSVNKNYQSHHHWWVRLHWSFLQSKGVLLNKYLCSSHPAWVITRLFHELVCNKFQVQVWGFVLACWFCFSQNGQGREKERSKVGGRKGEREGKKGKEKREEGKNWKNQKPWASRWSSVAALECFHSDGV